VANFAVGIPIDSNGHFAGSFLDLVQPAALFSGLLGLSLFITSGALYLALKIEGELQTRAYRISKIAVMASVALFAIATILTWGHSIICAAPLVLLLATVILIFRQHLKIAFFMVALCTVCCIAGLFFTLYPNVLVSSVAENSLTVMNSASSAYTLKTMSIVAVIFIPIILAYQIWSYYIFRKRISSRNIYSEV
jgi:cytochrome d ubiquinol oxidase subunit II